jgi:class 3 adenylate cyclase
VSACPSCGFENTSGAKFCSECGSPLAPLAARREERKVVSVLFADLVGFTSRAEQLDPEDVRALLTPYHARLKAELERFGGTVEKFIGDAVMALFGAPVAHEDDPERAVRAALAIRDAVGELNRVDESLDLRIRVGLTTGEALVAVDARPELGEGMAAGDVVNTAKRLEAAAPVNGVLVDEATQRATREVIDYGEHAAVEAKGKFRPVPAWEARSPRARAGVDVVQSARAPLVGRERELRTLLDVLERAHDGREPQLVTVVGAPGIGKSRLTWELFLAVDQSERLTYWRQGRSLPYGAGIAFWALGEMVKAHAGILDTDSAAETTEKLARAAATTFAENERDWVVRHLRTLVGLGDDALAGDHRGEVFAAWRRFVEAVAEERPLVLVFEDLHWADDGLLDFVDYLADRADAVPLLVVGTTRPELLERRPGWGGGKLNAQLVSLSALSDDDSARLLGALLERVVLPRDAEAELLARAAGNPLYAEQYVRMLVESGALVRRNGDWELGEDVELAAPESLHALIASRLDVLPAEEKALLEDAAVVGKVFWAGALAAVGGGERFALEDHLHALGRKDFVRRERRSSVGEESEYAFRHILVRDVAYGLIPRSARAEKHRRTAEWIEELSRERAEDVADMLAHHYASALEYAQAARQDTAELVDRARAALRAAGDRAAALNSFSVAASHYARALELCAPDDPERPRLLFALGSGHYFGEDAGAEELDEARAALLAQGDRELAALAEFYIAELGWRHGRDEGDRFDRAVELLRDEPPTITKAYVLATVGFFVASRRRHEEGIRICREGAELAHNLGREDVRAHGLILAGCVRTWARDFGGIEEMEEGLELAKTANSPYMLVGYANLGTTLLVLGRVDEGLRLLEEGTAAAGRFSEHWYARWQLANQLQVDVLRGRWDQALKLADEMAEQRTMTTFQWAVGWARGLIALGRGDMSGARAAADALAELASEIEEPMFRIPTAAFAAHFLAECDAPDAARAGYRDALDCWADSDEMPADWALALAYAGRSLGEQDSFVDLAKKQATGTPWLEAAMAVVRSDLPRAAEVLGEIGAELDEAYARLRAAEQLAAAGCTHEAARHAERALSFYLRVQARAYVQRAQSLLAARA